MEAGCELHGATASAGAKCTSTMPSRDPAYGVRRLLEVRFLARSLLMQVTCMIRLQNPASAAEHFGRKIAFSTGPVEVSHFIEQNESMTLVDVREAEDYAKGHLPGAINLPKSQWESAAGLQRNAM